MAAIARAADVATADVKIGKIEEVHSPPSLCACAESGLAGMHIRQLTRRLPNQITVARRRLLAEGIRVETSIKAADQSSATAMVNKLTASKSVF